MADDYPPLYCEGCGELVPIPEPRQDNPMVMREPSGNAAGRGTVLYGNKTIHQCADGTYLPPGEKAPPKSG